MRKSCLLGHTYPDYTLNHTDFDMAGMEQIVVQVPQTLIVLTEI